MVITFRSVDYEQMLAIVLGVDVRSKIRLTAAMNVQLVPGQKPVLAKPKAIESASVLLTGTAQRLKAEYQQFRAASTGDIREQLLAQKQIRNGDEFSYDQKREIEDQMEKEAGVAEERRLSFAKQIAESLPKWLERPIPIRITYQLGDRTILLAETESAVPPTAAND